MLLIGFLPGYGSSFDWKRAVAERPELADREPAERAALLERFEKDAYDWIVGFRFAGLIPTVAWLAIKGGLEPWAAQRLFTRWWNRSPRQSER